MIVKMKRLTLLCLATDRDAALESLRELGVVHVADVRPPEGDDLDALRARARGCRARAGRLARRGAARRGHRR